MLACANSGRRRQRAGGGGGGERRRGCALAIAGSAHSLVIAEMSTRLGWALEGSLGAQRTRPLLMLQTPSTAAAPVPRWARLVSRIASDMAPAAKARHSVRPHVGREAQSL